MANTYTQMYVQLVLAVDNADSLVEASWEHELFEFTTHIVKDCNHKLIAVNGIPDHVHLLIALNPSMSVAQTTSIIRDESARWINKNSLARAQFKWQEGYAAFSYSRSHLHYVHSYIMNQKELHKQKTFLAEYVELLEAFDIPYNSRQLFHPVIPK